MKTKLIFFSFLFAATAFTLLTYCSGNKKDEASESHSAHKEHESTATTESDVVEVNAPQFEVDAKFQEQLGDVFASYISLKEAFVSSDIEKIKLEAKKTSESLSKVNMKLVTGAAHMDWMTYLTSIQASIKSIEASSDIEVQRKAFSTLSDNLYKSIKAFGIGGKEVFYQYCPMAFNNEGGYWLSDHAKIRNPYFGDKMLTCGEVKENLQF